MKNKLNKIYWAFTIVSSLLLVLFFIFFPVRTLNAYEAHTIGVTATLNNYICGDGDLNPGEECDDGNDSNNDRCTTTCLLNEVPSCMKVNEVYYDPDKDHGGADAEWIELYNACEERINLKNWYLKDNNKTEMIHSNYIIEADQFVVIAANASVWNTYWDIIPENAVKIALGGQKMFDGLNNDGDRVFLYDNHNNEIDAVSWGNDNSAFNPSVTDVVQGHSIARATKGLDTNTAADWMDLASPNPGNNPHFISQEEPQTENPLEKIIPNPEVPNNNLPISDLGLESPSSDSPASDNPEGIQDEGNGQGQENSQQGESQNQSESPQTNSPDFPEQPDSVNQGNETPNQTETSENETPDLSEQEEENPELNNNPNNNPEGNLPPDSEEPSPDSEDSSKPPAEQGGNSDSVPAGDESTVQEDTQEIKTEEDVIPEINSEDTPQEDNPPEENQNQSPENTQNPSETQI